MHSCLKGEVEMYLEQAITRINNIDWDRVGTKSSVEDGNLGKEFLRRLANFYSKTLFKRYPPLASDIARLMGDNREANFEKYYNDKTKEFLCKTIYQSKVIEYYLKLSQLADDNPEARAYISVYEPLIEIFECGGSFNLRKNDLDIENVIFIPLNNWFDKFKAEQKDRNGVVDVDFYTKIKSYVGYIRVGLLVSMEFGKKGTVELFNLLYEERIGIDLFYETAI